MDNIQEELLFESKYSLSSEDYLVHLLFASSQSDQILKRRRITKIAIPIVYLILAIWLYYYGSISLSISFILLSILWYLFYPKYEKGKYKRYYKKYINENYKERIDKVGLIQISNTSFVTKDEGAESKMNITELKEIHEISDYIFLKFKNSSTCIFPIAKIEEINKLKSVLKQLAVDLDITYYFHEEWEWN